MGSAQYGRQTYQTQRSVNFKIVACLFSGRRNVGPCRRQTSPTFRRRPNAKSVSWNCCHLPLRDIVH